MKSLSAFVPTAFVLGGLALAGCGAIPGEVPMSAQLVSEGNLALSYRPSQFGRVYVTDLTDNRILYQADIDAGQRVDVNSRDDRIRVDGRTVSERMLDDSHQYRIYFEPMSRERVVRYRVEEVREVR